MFGTLGYIRECTEFEGLLPQLTPRSNLKFCSSLLHLKFQIEPQNQESVVQPEGIWRGVMILECHVRATFSWTSKFDSLHFLLKLSETNSISDLWTKRSMRINEFPHIFCEVQNGTGWQSWLAVQLMGGGQCPARKETGSQVLGSWNEEARANSGFWGSGKLL